MGISGSVKDSPKQPSHSCLEWLLHHGPLGENICPLSMTLTCFPYSCQEPNSSVQYQTQSVVRMKCGGLVTEEAVERRRAGAAPNIMESKSRQSKWKLLADSAHRILQKNVRGKLKSPPAKWTIGFHWVPGSSVPSRWPAGRCEHKCDTYLRGKNKRLQVGGGKDSWFLFKKIINLILSENKFLQDWSRKKRTILEIQKVKN